MENLKVREKLSAPPATARIKEDAARIKASADHVASQVLKRRAILDRTGQADRILAVSAGEMHYAPALHVHHVLVLANIAAETGVAFGYEFIHNAIMDFFCARRREKPTETALSHLQDLDRDGALSLKTHLSFYYDNYADQARSALFRFLLGSRIPTRFTDVAMTEQGTLDADDESTALSLHNCFRKVVRGLTVTSANGIYVRNDHMARLALDFAQTSGVRIVIQQCGNTHVVGDRFFGYKGRHSLTAQFERLGAAIMAMPAPWPDFTAASIPSDYKLGRNERLFPHKLPTLRAIYDPPDRPLPGEPAELQSREAEAAYVDALLDCLGFTSVIVTPDADRAQRDAYRAELADLITACPTMPAPAC